MYNSTKLSEDSLEFFQDLPAIARGDNELISIGVAKALANQLSIPSTQVSNPSDYFLQTNYALVRQAVSLINELCVLDLNRVQELTKLFWTVRYNIVYPRRKIFVSNQNSAESFFFGYGSLVPKNDAETIRQNVPILVNIFNGVAQAIFEVSETEEVNNEATLGR